MTDNEIMQALLCHESWGIDACDSCPLTPGKACGMQLAREALELINRQKSEIERLQAYNENLLSANTALSNEILDIRTEAIKEFAERLKEPFELYTDAEEADALYMVGLIDSLVKEMTEGPK